MKKYKCVKVKKCEERTHYDVGYSEPRWNDINEAYKTIEAWNNPQNCCACKYEVRENNDI